jgi:hypothetical protein
VGLGRLVEDPPRDARAAADRARVGVDVDRVEAAHVEGERSLADRGPVEAVAAAADRHRELLLARVGERQAHVVGVRRAHDHGRPPVDEAVEHAARALVALVAGSEDGAVDAFQGA